MINELTSRLLAASTGNINLSLAKHPNVVVLVGCPELSGPFSQDGAMVYSFDANSQEADDVQHGVHCRACAWQSLQFGDMVLFIGGDMHVAYEQILFMFDEQIGLVKPGFKECLGV